MQTRRGIIFIGLALLLALAAALAARRWVADQSVPLLSRGAAEVTPVVVARTDVGVAVALHERELGTVDWPTAHMPKGAITKPAVAAGRVLRRPVAAGEPILESALFAPGVRGGLGALISEKQRAVSVKVDSVVGVAGFIQPGSRVDVLATLRRIDKSKAVPMSKVILQDVRVLAIDQRMEEAKSGQPSSINIVTFEVDPVKAEHLIYAAHEGRLQLALRTPGDSEHVQTRSVGVADLMRETGPRTPKTVRVARRGPRVEVLKGASRQLRQF